jgi:hypothetical protein
LTAANSFLQEDLQALTKIFCFEKDSSGWRMAKPADGNINTPQSEAAQTLSPMVNG